MKKKKRREMYNGISDFERMVGGKLYNHHTRQE